MTKHEESVAMTELYQYIPYLSPSDLELMEMFEFFLNKEESTEEEVVSLPRGFGQ